jgi:hypothetical protein
VSDGVRIVLVKPGDYLAIGNAASLTDDDTGALADGVERIRTLLGVAGVLLFDGDVELASVSPSELAQSAGQGHCCCHGRSLTPGG